MTINYISTSVTVAGTATSANGGLLTIIAAGAVRVSTGGNALANLSTQDNCDVRVDGTLIGDLSGAVLASNGTTGSHSLTVGLTGVVLANSGYGASVEGDYASVVNYGQIGSSGGVGVRVDGVNASIINHGDIYSSSNNAVRIYGSFNYLQNYGTITANGTFAISALVSDGCVIENFGTIAASFSAMDLSPGNDIVRNHGQVLGTIFLDTGHDKFNGAGGSAVDVTAGAGVDTVRGSSFDDTLSGDSENDWLAGGAGDDWIYGGNQADVLFGGADDDLLYGGGEIDVMTGGSGADVFVFTNLAFMGNAIVADSITDFASGTDQIDLSAILGLSFIGKAAFSLVVDQVRYAKAAGQLQIDHNGDGVADFFVQLAAGTTLVAGDLIL